ncbi:MAG: glycosyltransferase family 4 protein [Bacteroidetes bacterium]|nr:glycosyltransferase family 4 protein [Bacteroidota bacterium]
MNIAIATTEFVSEKIFDGGLANYTYKLAKWLLSQKHEVTVYVSLKAEQDAVERFLYEDIRVVRICIQDRGWIVKYWFGRFGLGFLINPRLQYLLQLRHVSKVTNRYISEANRQSRIDIVHYSHLGGLSFYREKKIPCVVRLSGSTELCQKMGGYGASDLRMKIQAQFEYDAMEKADAVFGPSKMIAAMTEPKIGKQIRIIETPYIRPSQPEDSSVYNELLLGKKYILFFGSIGLIKGVGTIAEMIHDLLEKHPDLYYVFVGKQLNNTLNGKDVWDYLLEKASPYQKRIIYIPSQRQNTLFPIIRNAALVTLPSRTDNFPNTCIESMAHSKIVIGTKGNGFDQLIDDGKNGFVIEVDDHKALYNSISKVLSMDAIEKQTMEQKAFERTQKLSPDIVLEELMNLYQETIRKH